MVRRFTIIPADDPAQALRIRRFLMAAQSYLIWIVLACYGYVRGLTSITLKTLCFWLSLVVLANIVQYAILRTGYNKRFKDPSLTVGQMMVGLFFGLVVAYYADAARGAMLLVFIAVFIFGMFRLQVRQFMYLSMFVVIMYAGVIFALVRFKPGQFNLTVELLALTVLGVVLIWFSFIGGYINRLRENVIKANNELSRAMGTIAELAIHDDLTQVFNRRHFFTILQREKSLCDRGQSAFSLCMIDLDHFKRINDTHGHMMGDTVLKAIAQCIQDNIRSVDYIARYGGEEFALVLAYPDILDALKCAERIRQLCGALAFEALPESLHVTISMGVAQYVPEESIDELIRRADAALYRAKAGGRNRVEYLAAWSVQDRS